MLETEHHVIALFIRPEYRDAHKRIPLQIKAPQPVFLRFLIGIGCASCRIQMQQIFIFEADRLVPVHDLQRFRARAAVKISPQHDMPRGQFGPAFGENIDIQLAQQRKTRLFEVGARLRVHRAVEPHPLLHRRECVDILDLADRCRVFGNPFHVGNAQSLELYVARRQLRPFLSRAVGNNFPEALLQQRNQFLYRRSVKLFPAVAQV